MVKSIAILTGCLLVATGVPFLGAAMLVLAPLPILYYYFRSGRLACYKALSIAALLVSSILPLLEYRLNFLLLATIIYTGVMFSEVLNKRYSLNRSIATTSTSLFLVMGGAVLYGALTNGLTIWALIERHVSNLIRDNLKVYSQLNIQDDQIRLISDNAGPIAAFFVEIFPALLLSGAIVTAYVNIMAARWLLRRRGILFPELGDLTLWKAPERLVWVLIAAGGMLLSPVDPLNIVGMNLLLISCLLYLFQGLAIVAFFFHKKGVPSAFRWLFYLLILIQQYMVILVIAFGLFDLWADFRKRMSGTNDVPA